MWIPDTENGWCNMTGVRSVGVETEDAWFLVRARFPDGSFYTFAKYPTREEAVQHVDKIMAELFTPTGTLKWKV